MADGLFQMQRAIINYLNSKQKNEKSVGAVQGTYQNGRVLIENKTYYSDLAVDMPLRNGDRVWCLIADNNTTAVIVGA